MATHSVLAGPSAVAAPLATAVPPEVLMLVAPEEATATWSLRPLGLARQVALWAPELRVADTKNLSLSSKMLLMMAKMEWTGSTSPSSAQG